MFDADALHGFVNTLTVQTATMNAQTARAALVATAEAARDRVLHGSPKPSGYRQIVDGVAGAPLVAVRPDGVIVFAWQYLRLVAEDTREALVRRSPRDTGAYIDSILFLVDGQQADAEAITGETKEVHIVPGVPYARRLEVGKRKDGQPFVQQVAPHIVQETATVAKRLYDDLADIRFTYVDLNDAYYIRSPAGWRKRGFKEFAKHGTGRPIVEKFVRYPAILITPRVA